MHRSGTSALTRMLSIAGAKLPEHLLLPSKGNEVGHWEPDTLIRFHDELLSELGSSWDDWRALDLIQLSEQRLIEVRKQVTDILQAEFGEEPLFVLKDPRICRFTAFYIELLQNIGISVCPILPLRNPLEVCESLAERDDMSLGGAALLWLRHVLNAERMTRNVKRQIVSYPQLLENWAVVYDAIQEQFHLKMFLSIDEIESEVSAFISPGYCHHSRTMRDVIDNPVLTDWISKAYDALLVLSEHPSSEKAISILDEITVEFDRVSPLFADMHDSQKTDYKKKIDVASRKLKSANKKIEQLENDNSVKLQAVDKLNQIVIQRDSEKEILNNVLEETKENLNAKSMLLSQSENKNENLMRVISQRDTEIIDLKNENDIRDKKINNLDSSLRESDKQVEIIRSRYKDVEQQLQAMKLSKTWRYSAPIRRLAEIYKYRSLKKPRISSVNSFTEEMIPLPERDNPQAQLTPDEIEKQCASIKYRQHSMPEISIIVPVYNQIEYTLNCLRSIMKQETPFSYEVLIMDDCSPDSTVQLLKNIEGLRYYKNQKNLGFLRNCNRGAELAHGNYLVFLNNDTLVEANWLMSLRELFDSQDNVGLVGSKLVYPDGRLQEAGGIVWEDASAWNWGHSQDPQHPRYNYVRDADYISGASIMIEKDFFDRLNKFDERFLPAYYEDTDLCFSVRAAGLRVVYQPASVAVHYEGVSSGTDLSSGVKQYQVSNKENFFDKWQDVLSTYLPNGVMPEVASDRVVKGHVLIIDACTPTPDQDSGSLDMYNLIKILIDQGFRVHFIPYTNFAHFGRYTADLQQMGVECIYAPYYKTSKAYLKENGSLFSNIILSRVSVAHETIDQVRRYCDKAKVIFYTVDLHFLREQREAELSGNARKKKLADETRDRELAIMDKSDTTIVLSEIEKQQLEKLGKKHIELVPLIRDIEDISVSPFENRNGVLFIGGYQHTPNVDAVDWLVDEIWPEIRKLVKENGWQPITLHLYGSQMPERFKEIPDEDIHAHGFIENLSRAFDSVRLSVAPLRYGAGLKGKIATSLEQGVPVVGSNLAFEGMSQQGIEDIKACSDNAKDIAQLIVDIYNDREHWYKASAAGKSYVRDQYSLENVFEKIATIVKVM